MKSYTQKLLADYQVFLVFWAILIVKLNDILPVLWIFHGHGYAAGNWVVARVKWRASQNLLFTQGNNSDAACPEYFCNHSIVYEGSLFPSPL